VVFGSGWEGDNLLHALHDSVILQRVLTLYSVEAARFQGLDDLVLEPDHLVVLFLAEVEVDTDIFPHPFTDDIKAFEDEPQFRVTEFVHDPVILLLMLSFSLSVRFSHSAVSATSAAIFLPRAFF